MTYDEVKDLFGGEDKSPYETALRLSTKRPDFGAEDLLDVFSAVKDNFRKKDDVNFRSAQIASSNVSNWAKAVAAAHDARTYYASDVVFRNVWRVMFETSEWDQDILFQPDFFGRFSEFVETAKPKHRKSRRCFASMPSRDVPERNALDFWEAAAEFQDALAEKIRGASGA